MTKVNREQERTGNFRHPDPQTAELNQPSEPTLSALPLPGSPSSKQRLKLRLKFYFAVISCLGGLVLASGTDGSALSIFAVFFAAFGFVFVDWLEFFALPAVAAYAAMGVAAMFCVGDFVELNAPGQHQMGVVAQLLVFVQAILMLQKKSRRIFEQLAVFCLLELTVAAVFNDALLFGILLIPIALIGAMALSLIAGTCVIEGVTEPNEGKNSKKASQAQRQTQWLSVNADHNWLSIVSIAPKFSRLILWMLAPAVIIISMIFFYALPRTTDAARVESRGRAMVGFSDELRLGQIGQMMQSTQPALRVDLRHPNTGEPYNVTGGIYLRGKVLERYEEFNSVTLTGASWNSLPAGYLSEPERLPDAYVPAQPSDESYYDNVDVKITCESMRSDALFAIAPYHRTDEMSAVMHFAELWTLGRERRSDWIYPRIEYRFGSHAFRSGIQTDLKSFRHNGDPFYRGLSVSRTQIASSAIDVERQTQGYIEELLLFSEVTMPTISDVGESFVVDSEGQRRSDYAIAKAMESYFSKEGKYQYTLNLDADPVPGLDPIEQFVRIDQRGHCQFFASALAMMLRSQGIPARVVAGYHTDEYNDIAKHYIARQLHAHAWVEALIDVNLDDGTPLVFGQPVTTQYWLRLDPTPPAGRVRESGRVGQVLDLAQTVWDDYIVEMDGERQNASLVNGGSKSMNQSYRKVIDQLGLFVRRIRAGQLGGGSLANRNWFSWQAPLVAGAFLFIVVGVLRLRTVRVKKRTGKTALSPTMTPSIPFYAEAIHLVKKLGIEPRLGQTPKEFSLVAISRFRETGEETPASAFSFLTECFYRERYGMLWVGSGIAKDPKIVDASSRFNVHAERSAKRSLSSSEDQVAKALTELADGVETLLRRDSERKRNT